MRSSLLKQAMQVEPHWRAKCLDWRWGTFDMEVGGGRGGGDDRIWGARVVWEGRQAGRREEEEEEEEEEGGSAVGERGGERCRKLQRT
eukprot:767444-Hanusia_phi.AAC.13